MEKQLGFPVFERGNRKVLVTPAGWQVLDRARSIALQMAANHDPLSAAPIEEQGFGWKNKCGTGAGQVPDAHDPKKRHSPIMFTTDMALKMDSGFRKISERFLNANTAEVQQGVFTTAPGVAFLFTLFEQR